jgi:hypothetical protein
LDDPGKHRIWSTLSARIYIHFDKLRFPFVELTHPQCRIFLEFDISNDSNCWRSCEPQENSYRYLFLSTDVGPNRIALDMTFTGDWLSFEGERSAGLPRCAHPRHIRRPQAERWLSLVAARQRLSSMARSGTLFVTSRRMCRRSISLGRTKLRVWSEVGGPPVKRSSGQV